MLIVLGGFGVVKNFCIFVVDGENCLFNEDVLNVCKFFVQVKKLVVYVCIVLVLVVKVYGNYVKLIIGNDEGMVNGVNVLGVLYVDCKVDEVVVDNDVKFVIIFVYMLVESVF